MSIIMCFDAVSVVVHCHSRHRNVEWFSFFSYFIVTEEPRNSTPNAFHHHIHHHDQTSIWSARSWRRADDDFMGDLHLGDGINAIFRNLQSFRNGQNGPNGRTQPQPTPSTPRRTHSADAPMDRDHGHGQLEVEWPRFEAVIDILSL